MCAVIGGIGVTMGVATGGSHRAYQYHTHYITPLFHDSKDSMWKARHINVTHKKVTHSGVKHHCVIFCQVQRIG